VRQLSGGERRRVALALALGFGDLVAQRGRLRCNLVVLDEVRHCKVDYMEHYWTVSTLSQSWRASRKSGISQVSRGQSLLQTANHSVAQHGPNSS
jgi:ABC-type Mn2+/Zn2+ transport system ATPase subunit